MLGRAGTGAKKASKFEDSDSSSHTSRPRAMSDLPHRPAPRVPTRPRTATLAAGSEVHGARHRGAGVARGTAPRSPLQEKKPAGAGVGAGSRAAELEVKLGKAHDQLAAMREQLAAAEKARKEARGVFAEAKKRFAARKRDVAAPARDEVEHDNNVRPPEHKQQQQEAEVATADVVNGDSVERRGIMDSENNGSQVEEEEAEKKTTDNGDEVNRNNNIAVVGDDGGGGNKGNPEADQLWTKLMAKDREVYELRAKLMLRDMEVDELKAELTAKDANIGTLMAELVAKDAEFAALRAENVELTQTASEAAEVERKTTASKAREAERALMDSAAREARLAERLRESERAREALEAEARCSRVQSGQWRKAAEEAAAVLGGAGHQVCARGAEETEEDKLRDAGDEGSSGKRKPAGGAVRLLADLWKKRASK